MQSPFSLSSPSPFVGYHPELLRLSLSLRAGSQLLAVRGPSGSGKTALLKELARRFDAGTGLRPGVGALYLPALPAPAEWPAALSPLLPRRWPGRAPKTMAELTQALPRLRERIVLCIDSADAAEPAALSSLRALTDASPLLSIVFAASSDWQPPAPIADRLECAVALAGLDPSAFRELIRQRVRACGGSDIEPFTSDALLAIHREARGLPLPALRRCADLAERAREQQLTAIDPSFFTPSFDAHGPKRSQESAPIHSAVASLPFSAPAQPAALPALQRQLVDTLSVVGPLTPTELAASLDSGYKDRATAARAVNNLLSRLHRAGVVSRSREGRAYRYALAAAPALK